MGRKRNNERPSPLNERDRERARARERQRRSGLLLSDVVRKHNTVDRKTTVGRGLREAFSRSVFFFWFLVFGFSKGKRRAWKKRKSGTASAFVLLFTPLSFLTFAFDLFLSRRSASLCANARAFRFP